MYVVLCGSLSTNNYTTTLGLLSDNDDEYTDDDDDIIEEDDDSGQKQQQNEEEDNKNFDSSSTSGSIIPFDLSVNHLKPTAPGKPMQPLSKHASIATVSEDFLPVVLPTDIKFRWRQKPKIDSLVEHAAKVTAYRIEARRSGISGTVLWDSTKIKVDDELPFSISWPDDSLLKPGDIIKWKVTLWDIAHAAHTSSWSKFAVGPASESDWEGDWIVHPVDMKTFSKEERDEIPDDCDRWKKRHSLPVFRGQISAQEFESIMNDEDDPLTSVLLVVSGLGSFRVSVDGVPLSPSGPIDPPFTDYTQRVMYRGFDVTPFIFASEDNSHVIEITVGSGWWDHRPLESSIVKFNLLPRGPATVIAQLYLTTSKGNVSIVLPTQEGSEQNTQWRVRRGHIRESDLFTGEIVDVDMMSSGGEERSVYPIKYHTDITTEDRREEIAIKAKAKQQTSKKFRTYDNFAAPIGKLVPSEIPPILPMERIAADEIHDLGGGRWLFDFGKAFSGMLHFDEGVPTPIIPKNYPRGHGYKEGTDKGESFITVIYGESLEMTTGDINRVLQPSCILNSAR